MCESIANKLIGAGIKARPYHAGLNSKTRDENQEEWQQDKVKVIVATVSFGMGINKAAVGSVIHWDLPKNISSYYQESGRAGRSTTEKAICRLYYSRDDRNKLAFILQSSQDQSSTKRDPNKIKYFLNHYKNFDKLAY